MGQNRHKEEESARRETYRKHHGYSIWDKKVFNRQSVRHSQSNVSRILLGSEQKGEKKGGCVSWRDGREAREGGDEGAVRKRESKKKVDRGGNLTLGTYR